MTCIGGRRPVRILRGDCIIIGYADTGSTNEGVSLLLFHFSLLDFPVPAPQRGCNYCTVELAGIHDSVVQDQLCRADSLKRTATLAHDV